VSDRQGGRIAVVGGGWSGLACAVTLADAGCAVTVFEAGATPGGRARRVEQRRMTTDNGQHLLLGAYRSTLAMIRQVNPQATASELYLRTPLSLAGPGRFALRAPPLPAPLHMLAALLSARDCTWSERRAVVRAFRRWQAEGWRCAEHMTVSALTADQPVRMVARLWSPLCLAALNTPPVAASAQVFLNVVRDALARTRGDSDLVIPGVDLSRLFPEPAAAWIAARGGTVRTGSVVRRLVGAGNRIALELRGSGAYERFDAAVIATAPWQADALLRDVPDTAATRALLAAYRYEPITTIYLACDRRVPLREPMRQLQDGPGQWIFARTPSKESGTRLAVVISADGPHRLLSHTQLVDAVCAQIGRELGTAAVIPVAAQVITERRATHACVAARRHPPAGRIAPCLYLAGDHTDPEYPGTLEAAVRSGIRAGRAVLDTSGA
jgi:squalene-associated FAD-dependent desaturase